MQNIIKSLQYRVPRDNVTYYAILAAVGVIFMGLMTSPDPLSLTGSTYYITLPVASISISILISVLATRICGWDYADKTINYEILIGHKRKDIYWSRIITSFVWCFTVSVLILVVPALIFSLMNGWGNSMDMVDTAVRILVALAAVFRMYCEAALLTFLTKSCYLGLITAFAYFEAVYTAVMTLDMFGAAKVEDTYLLSSMATLERMMTFDEYSFEYINGADVQVFNAALEPTTIALTVSVSIAVGIACLVLGYLYFRKSDMK